MSTYSYQPTSAAAIFRAEVPCDTAGWIVSPCSSNNSDTVIKVYGQGLQSCTAITATGGNSPATPIPVTPNLAGTELTFTKPSSPYGWTRFDCLAQTISAFLSSGVNTFNNASLTYSSTTVAPGDQITVTSTYSMFVTVSSVTVGGVSATFSILDYNRMLLTIPSGLSSGSKAITLTNISGAGTKSAALTVSGGVSAPGTPGTPTAVAGNASSTVTVVAPSTGGTPVTYTVTASPGGATCTVTVPATSCSVTGLTNGTSYTFAANATNTGGTSSSSVSSASVTPATVPGAPSIGSITAGDQQLSVPFTAPGSNGGASITNYKYSTDNGSTWTSAGSTTSPIVITGLTNGTTYDVKLRAVNPAGDGTASVAVSATPVASVTVPGAPSIGSITAGDQQLSVPFTAPGSNGGASITNYKYSTDNGSTWTSVGSTTSPIVITGLTNGTAYDVKLRAVNTAGDGTASSAVSATPVAPQVQVQAPSSSGPSTPAAPPTPPANVESVKVVQGVGNKGSVLTVKLEPQQDAKEGTTVIVKIFNLQGKVIQELKVPVNAQASSFELPINLKVGEFTVEAQTVNATGSAPPVATLPTFAPQSFFEVTKNASEPVLLGTKISSPIVFNPNSFKLTDAAKKALLEIAAKIKQSNSRVALTGFTASANQGKQIEQKLATARALEVAKFLKSQGIQKWIYFAGFGALNPKTPATQARKVELRLIK
jgi:outer membrane protein OmpA-like peptidoglycan-associated protein/predicted RNA-binding protein with TRAM domain